VSEVAVEVNSAVKQFGRVRALDGLSLRVRVGENYGLLGPNGSGKTTLIRAIAGVIRLTAGTARVLGIQVPSSSAAGAVGYMTQSASLYEDLTARENVTFFARLYGIGRKEAHECVEEALELVGLGDRAGSLVRTLSGGMRQRTNLACALVHRPRVLLLDEPTVGVDPRLRRTLWEHFRRLNRQGVTLLVSTHVMDEAEHCSRIGLMKNGRLLAEGAPSELRDRAGTDDLEEAFLRFEERAWDEGRVSRP